MRTLLKVLALICALIVFFIESPETVKTVLLIEVALLWLVVLYDDINLLKETDEL